MHPIYLLWFQTKPKEFGFQLRFGNQWFCNFTVGFFNITIFNLVLKLNPALKPNLKPEQINWVMVHLWGMYRKVFVFQNEFGESTIKGMSKKDQQYVSTFI